MAPFTRQRQALPWVFLLTLSSITLAACSGGSVDNSSTGGSPATTDPGSSTPSDPTYPPGTTPTPAPVPSGPIAATDTTVTLSWQPNSDPIAGYIVYYGPTADGATTLATQLSLSSIDPQAPSVSFNAGTDLGLNYGDGICFRLRAYNSANVMSDWSGAACGTI